MIFLILFVYPGFLLGFSVRVKEGEVWGILHVKATKKYEHLSDSFFLPTFQQKKKTKNEHEEKQN